MSHASHQRLSTKPMQGQSRDYFTNYVGDLLILDAGDGGSSSNGKIYVLKWDVASNSFLTRRLLSFPGPLEHATFAPVNLPPLTP